MAQFIGDEGISEERGGHEWLSCVKNRAKFKMPHSPICDEYLRHRAKVSDTPHPVERDGLLSNVAGVACLREDRT